MKFGFTDMNMNILKSAIFINAQTPRHPAVYTMPSTFQPIHACRRGASPYTLYTAALPPHITSTKPDINDAT